jgi:hypothetical protein
LKQYRRENVLFERHRTAENILQGAMNLLSDTRQEGN